MSHRVCSVLLLLPLVAFSSRSAGAQLAAQEVAAGLVAPVAFVQMPSEPSTQVIAEQGGRIRLFVGGTLRDDDFLDLSPMVKSGGELGLLGLAFSPAYASDGRVFVSFIDQNGNTVIARFTSTDDRWHLNPDSRRDLVWPDGRAYIEQPTASHKGGNMAFGPDGFLYLGLGDGGPGDDPDHRSQDPLSLLGKMLRLDVSVADDDAEGYDVPSSNPFVGRDDILNVIWAFGLRNPWRWSFDDPSHGGTGALVIGDVGQNQWEEIDYEPAGAGGRNYGWRNREAAHDYVTDLTSFSDTLTDPVFEYDHDTGRSVIGGVVYRGQALGASYSGLYFFGDYVAGRVWTLRLDVNPETGDATAAGLTELPGLDAGAVALSSFGVDAAGELYLVSHATGAVFRVVLASGPPTPAPTPQPPGACDGFQIPLPRSGEARALAVDGSHREWEVLRHHSRHLPHRHPQDRR
ncbi:MAG: PQQ-dependent sugar dehydrogenase [Vicinamibacterales bacterium]